MFYLFHQAYQMTWLVVNRYFPLGTLIFINLPMAMYPWSWLIANAEGWSPVCDLLTSFKAVGLNSCSSLEKSKFDNLNTFLNILFTCMWFLYYCHDLDQELLGINYLKSFQ